MQIEPLPMLSKAIRLPAFWERVIARRLGHLERYYIRAYICAPNPAKMKPKMPEGRHDPCRIPVSWRCKLLDLSGYCLREGAQDLESRGTPEPVKANDVGLEAWGEFVRKLTREFKALRLRVCAWPDSGTC